MRRRLALAGLSLVLALGVEGPAQAGPTPAQKCEAAKLKLVCKKTCCELGIAAKGGTAFTKCTTGFSTAFGKIKGTCGVGAAALEAKVDTFEADVTSEVKPASNKCEAGKIKAVCKKVCCELGADGKAVVKGGMADFTKCRSNFSGTFGKLETKGGCATSGDATAIESKVETFVADVFDEVTTPAPRCGDGVVNAPGEQCDPPGSTCPDGQPCNADCTCPPLKCGNGVVDPGEDCDPSAPGPGNTCPGGATCSLSCTCPVCCEATGPGGALCFETEHARPPTTPDKCQLLSGMVVAGTCDPTTMLCAPSPTPPAVSFCCECTSTPAAPIFPFVCFDSPTAAKCAASGCTAVASATCDACAERCVGPAGTPPPLPAGTDTFPSSAQITVNVFPNPCGVPTGPHTISLLSPPGMNTMVQRGMQAGDTIPTELVQLELQGTDPLLGPIRVHQNPDPTKTSKGMVEDVRQTPAGDFASGRSFFDVFVTIDLTTPLCGPLTLANTQAVRMQANCITSLPPGASQGDGTCKYTPPPAPGQPLVINGTTVQVGSIQHAQHLAGGGMCH